MFSFNTDNNYHNITTPHFMFNFTLVKDSFDLHSSSFSLDYNSLTNIYRNHIEKHNLMCYNALVRDMTFDAGFDLFVPYSETVSAHSTCKINHCIRSSMEFFDGTHRKPCGYYLYPRSSTGSKTPLRLANSVGIIDSGYRGDIIAVFDNNSNTDFKINEQQRFAQICPPNLTYPMLVNYVDDISLLGTTGRGTGGFGSTGK